MARALLERRRWSSLGRVAAAAAGGALLGWGGRRGRVVGTLGVLLGVELAGRAVLEAGAARWVPPLGRPIQLTRRIHVQAPVEAVFAVWSDLERFPELMRDVRAVRRLGINRFEWVVGGPFGAPVRWVASVTDLEVNRLVAWASEPGMLVEHEGFVQFVPRRGGTEVHVHVEYRPAGGPLGHGLAWLTGNDPQRRLEEDLVRFKRRLERPTHPAVASA